MRTYKYVMFMVIIIIVISVLGLAGCDNKEGDELMEEKVKVQQYLKEKYGKEFVVEKSYYYSQQLSVKPVIKSDVYPKGENSIKVEVVRANDGSYTDNYLQKFWSNEASNDIKELIENLYGDKAIYYVGVGSKDLRFYDKKWVKIPSYKEFIGQYNENIGYSVYLAVFSDTETNLSESEASNIYKIISFVQKLKFKNNGVYISYYQVQAQEDIKRRLLTKELSNIIIGDIGGASGKNNNLTKYLIIEYDDFYNIKKPSDVLKSIKIKN